MKMAEEDEVLHRLPSQWYYSIDGIYNLQLSIGVSKA